MMTSTSSLISAVGGPIGGLVTALRRQLSPTTSQAPARHPAILPAIQPAIQLLLKPLPAILPVIAVPGLLSFSSRLIVLVEAARVEDDSKVGSLGKVVRVLLAVGAGVVLPSQVLGRAIKACAIKSCAVKAGAVKVSSGSYRQGECEFLKQVRSRFAPSKVRSMFAPCPAGSEVWVLFILYRQIKSGFAPCLASRSGRSGGSTMPASRQSHYR